MSMYVESSRRRVWRAMTSACCAGLLSACGHGDSGVVPTAPAGVGAPAAKIVSTTTGVTTITAPPPAYGSAVLGVSNSGVVYFGGENNYIPGFCLYLANPCSGATSDGLYSYSGGAFTLTMPRGPYFGFSSGEITCDGVPLPGPPCSLGNVSAIDANQFSQILWASDYAPDSFFIPVSELQSGGPGGTATTPPAAYNDPVAAADDEVVSILRAGNGQFWIGAGGPTPGIYPAVLPAICHPQPSPCDLFFLTNGPRGDVWAMTRTYSSSGGSTGGSPPTASAFFEYGQSGSLKNTFSIPQVAVNIAGTTNYVWFTDYANNAVGRLNRNGKVREYTVPTENAGPYGIAAAADGSIWFTEYNAHKVGRLDKHGHFQEFAISFAPFSIATTPPGCVNPAVWVGSLGPQLAEITPVKL